jgi:hypothetical protein
MVFDGTDCLLGNMAEIAGTMRGAFMTEPDRNRQGEDPVSSARSDLTQLDFELEFFDRILAHSPDYVDVLRAQASNLCSKGLHSRGLAADRRIVQLRPNDPTAYYNLACSYSRMQMNGAAIDALHSCLKLGFCDFEQIMSDPDLESLRKDSRFVRVLGRFLLDAVKSPKATRAK